MLWALAFFLHFQNIAIVVCHIVLRKSSLSYDITESCIQETMNIPEQHWVLILQYLILYYKNDLKILEFFFFLTVYNIYTESDAALVTSFG